LEPDDYEAQERRLMEFMANHPELTDQLGLWRASASTLEAVDPEAAEILRRELPELAG
jgi:hypothetical protein